ncbi:PIN-like domain-containing protein, partial [Pediococcus ethanolidurans]|uniref:PIN-like domain-containing protein n=1 Tax=Pediococcus ethanolidurans TaxID=319653 RepID=UPI0021E7A73B
KLYTEANKRYLNGLPFGNQSSDNDLSGYEYYIIWHDILSLNQNIIFVSDTIKKDWTNISIDGRVLSSNTFLTQEFFEKTKGHYFAQMTTKELIAHWQLN